jgi:DNA-binding XRE family transcriptional regulator
LKPKKNILLEAKILEKGETNETLASYIGVNPSTLLNKRSGASDWKVGELIVLAKKLEFSEKQFIDTFFTNIFA